MTTEYLGLMSLLETAASMMTERRDEITKALETIARIHTLGGVGLPPVGLDEYRDALQDGRLNYQAGLLRAARDFADSVTRLREDIDV